MGLSARGSRNVHDEIEKIDDESELAQVQDQARGVQIKSLVTAVILTIIVLALPVL